MKSISSSEKRQGETPRVLGSRGWRWDRTIDTRNCCFSRKSACDSIPGAFCSFQLLDECEFVCLCVCTVSRGGLVCRNVKSHLWIFAIFANCHRPHWLLLAWGYIPLLTPRPGCGTGSVWKPQKSAELFISVKQKFPGEIFSWFSIAGCPSPSPGQEQGVPGGLLPRTRLCPGASVGGDPSALSPATLWLLFLGREQQDTGTSPCWRCWGCRGRSEDVLEEMPNPEAVSAGNALGAPPRGVSCSGGFGEGKWGHP